MPNVLLVLAIGAFVCALLNAIGKVPGWVALILLALIELLHVLPLGR